MTYGMSYKVKEPNMYRGFRFESVFFFFINIQIILNGKCLVKYMMDHRH